MRPNFPGMDPWLEHPALWPDVHNSLIAAIRDAITDQLPERYYIALEERTVISVPWAEPIASRPDLSIATDRPVEPDAHGAVPEAETGVLVVDLELRIDEPIRETFLEIREASEGRLVTVIELLSPSNKQHPRTRRQYEKKRKKILWTRTNFIEIDLLRAGEPMPQTDLFDVRSAAYRILICRGWNRPRGRLYAFGVRTPLPDLPIPLLRDDAEPTVRLNAVFQSLCDRARYFMRVKYDQPPVPPLGEADAAWAERSSPGRNDPIAERRRPVDQSSSEPTSSTAMSSG